MSLAFEIASKFSSKPRRAKNGGWRTSCPNAGGHKNGDKHQSCAFWDKPQANWVAYYCQKCDVSDVTRALADNGIHRPNTSKNIYPGIREEITREGEKLTYYSDWDYRDEENRIVMKVVRYNAESGGKVFFPFIPINYENRWKIGRGSIPRLLYNLPELLEAGKKNELIWLVEGEKCAQYLGTHDLLATTAHGGSKRAWEESYTKSLTGCRVAIIADNDKTGATYARRVANQLSLAKIDTKVLFLPGLEREGEDIYEWLRLYGHTTEDLEILYNTAENWKYDPEYDTSSQVVRIFPEQADEDFLDTEKANADRLLKAYGEDYLFTAGKSGGWWHYDGTRYAKDGLLTLENKAKDLSKLIKKEAFEAHGAKRQALLDWAKKSEKASVIRESINLIRSDRAINEAEFDSDPLLLNVKNGVLDLREDKPKLIPHDRSQRLTRLANVIYEEKEECELFNSKLDDIFRVNGVVNQDVIDFLWAWFGYCMTGLDTEQRFVYFYSDEGGAGKGTIFNTMLSILGDYGTEVSKEIILAQKHSTKHANAIQMHNARLAIFDEINRNERIDEGMLKQLTGGGKTRVSKLFEESFQMKVSAKPILQGNHKARIDGTDGGIKRRMCFVYFPNHFGNEDPTLVEKLQTEKEKSGILNMMISGLAAWRSNNRKINVPLCIQKETQSYLTEEDRIGCFLTDNCELHALYSWSCPSLYKIYREWAVDQGFSPVNQNNFTKDILKHTEITRVRDDTTRRYEYRGVQPILHYRLRSEKYE